MGGSRDGERGLRSEGGTTYGVRKGHSLQE